MNNQTCKHGGVSPAALLAGLHESQAGFGRHKCPTCAYEQGFNLGSSNKWDSYDSFCSTLTDAESCPEGSIAPISLLNNLGDNQGGVGRHKCTNCAFKHGFEESLLANSTNEISIELFPVPKTGLINSKSGTSTKALNNFLEREMRNKQLGYLGELFILKNEISFLNKQNKTYLSNLVKHVSVEIGDGLGYDILSFDLEGSKKMIEAKTTRGDISRPFFLTKNEIDISAHDPENYYLYRLFDFDSKLNKGKYYILKGDLTNMVTLDSVLFLAFPISKITI